MIKRFFLVFFLVSFFAKAQNCGDTIIFDSQAEADAFAASNSGTCDSIGKLILRQGVFTDFTAFTFINSIDEINIQQAASISSFQGFENITSLDKIFLHQSGTINSFTGLNNVNFINIFQILSGTTVNSFVGLENVINITAFNIESNTELSNGFNGFSNINEITSLSINGTINGLTNFNGLESLDKLINLTITFNGTIQNLSGLENVTILRSMRLQNLNFQNFNELQNVANTNFSFIRIVNCDQLLSFDVLNIESINNGDSEITNNDNLSSVSSLDGLINTNSYQFNISSNPLLNDCCFSLPIINSGFPVNLIISNNGSQCFDNQSIINNCGANFDSDNDGAFDDVDVCPDIYNPDQTDMDGDGLGDICDDDIDGDSIINELDNCPYVSNTGQLDTDNNGIGDACINLSGPDTGFVGIGTNTPNSKLHVAEGDVFIDNIHRGIIMKKFDGACVRVKLAQDGLSFTFTPIDCPDN